MPSWRTCLRQRYRARRAGTKLRQPAPARRCPPTRACIAPLAACARAHTHTSPNRVRFARRSLSSRSEERRLSRNAQHSAEEKERDSLETWADATGTELHRRRLEQRQHSPTATRVQAKSGDYDKTETGRQPREDAEPVHHRDAEEAERESLHVWADATGTELHRRRAQNGSGTRPAVHPPQHRLAVHQSWRCLPGYFKRIHRFKRCSFCVPSSRIYENTRTCTDASGPDETEVDLEQHSPAEKEQESLERWAAITGTELHRAQASADGQADGLKEAQVYPPLKMTASAYTLRHPTHGWLAPSLPRRDRIAPQYVNNVQNSQRSIKPGEALLPV